MRNYLKTISQPVFLVAISIAMALVVNAVSPHGIPLRPMTHKTDWPPADMAKINAEESEYITLDMVREASEFGLAVLIDARKAEEFEDGHIPSAINLSVNNLREKRDNALNAIDADSVIIVYCEDPDCGSSTIVAEQLRLLGKFDPENIRVFTGGYPEWQQYGLDVDYGKL